jgi:glycosyltransferase involved in cell wall biosynthesis
MRVLPVDSGREWRGGQNQVRLLCRELVADPQIDLRLATQRGSELERRAAASGITVRGLPWTIGLDPRAVWGLYRTMVRFQPDIVHAHDSHALTVASAAARLLTRQRRFDEGRFWNVLWWPLSLVTAPWDDDELRPRLVGTRRVDFHIRPRSAWRRLDRVIAISEAVKQILVRDGQNPRDVAVVPSGVDADEVRRDAARPLDIRRRLGLAPGTPLAANVAALVDHKDQRTLIRAAGTARALRPDLHWVIAGEGPLRGSLEAEIARLDLRDRVHLLGYIEEADALIREANVFVMSSKEEGLGSVILNALALEKPVVATAGGGIPEILPGDALVPVGDADRLAQRVVQVVAHPPAPNPLPARFTARAMAHGVLAVYRSLL